VIKLICALDRETDAEADDKAALMHEDQERQAAKVAGDLLAVERDERRSCSVAGQTDYRSRRAPTWRPPRCSMCSW
jgi:hypothetical protein